MVNSVCNPSFVGILQDQYRPNDVNDESLNPFNAIKMNATQTVRVCL